MSYENNFSRLLLLFGRPFATVAKSVLYLIKYMFCMQALTLRAHVNIGYVEI